MGIVQQDTVGESTASKDTAEKMKILELAKKRLKWAVEADKHNRLNAINDLKFLDGDQWDEGEKKRRDDSGRAYLTINLLPKYVNQVTGDGRLNRPQIKIRPANSEANIEIAKIREGIIRNIEYSSTAEIIYDDAFELMVACGLGAWRVLTRYTDDMSFEQEIYIAPCKNPHAVYLDPSGNDDYGFVIDKLPREEFQEKYPKATVPSKDNRDAVGVDYMDWWDETSVTVMEYFCKNRTAKTIVHLSNGSVMEKSEFEKQQRQSVPSPDIANVDIAPITILQERKTEKIEIKHYLISFSDVLEAHNWSGEYIPLVLIYGRELNIEGKIYRKGLVRNAKDSQKLYNYWHTLGAETIALAPKTPYLVTPAQVAEFEDDWKVANISNFPYLKYNPDPLAPGPPQRQFPQQTPTGIFTELNVCKIDLDETTGIFRAGLGAPSNEKSGVAIVARQKESDVGSYAYIDNLKRGIIQTGKICNNLIPFIYDTERKIVSRNMDGSEQFVPINTTAGDAIQAIKSNPTRYRSLNLQKLLRSAMQDGKDTPFNDISVGKYNVVVTTGPSYTTARIETVDNMIKLFQTAPQITQVAADILVKNMDFPGAEELAERLIKTLPPHLRPVKEDEAPAPLPPPTIAEELEAEKLQIEKLKIQLEMKKIESEYPEINKNSTEEIRQIVMEILQEMMAGGARPPISPLEPPIDNTEIMV
jgi:hypothetical protein